MQSSVLRSRFVIAVCSIVIGGAVSGCSEPEYDFVLRGGTIYDGSGSPPIVADVGIKGDSIAAIGDLAQASGRRELDVSGLAVAPGFINVLSWATESLIPDGRGQSDIRQGVTLEVFGEGWSMGPLTETMKKDLVGGQSDIRFDVEWTSLGEYMESLERRGVSPNIASFVGATTVRVHELGLDDRPPNPEELERMRALVREAMEEGALGLGSSLIYAPAFYADTDELIELARVVSEYDGLYISHIRNEGNRLVEAVEELIQVAREADVRSEIYHLKAAGSDNWSKLDEVIRIVEDARSEGLAITADMYTYTAGATGLDAAMPPWVQEGGFEQWRLRLMDTSIRARVAREMMSPTGEWENLMLAAGVENVLLVGFRKAHLRPLVGKTLVEIAEDRGTRPEITAMDLVVEDSSRVEAVYFLMSEDNVRRKIQLPWVSFGSDAAAQAPEGVFLNANPHPRAYGNVARLLGRYVRQEQLIPLEEAVRRLTSFPARNLRIARRGALAPGYFADITVFDPDRISDRATYSDPHRYAVGTLHVLVNGEPVLIDGEHTGALPGRFIRRAR
jgi:N-acyl-D-amino-acid deacylase